MKHPVDQFFCDLPHLWSVPFSPSLAAIFAGLDGEPGRLGVGRGSTQPIHRLHGNNRYQVEAIPSLSQVRHDLPLDEEQAEGDAEGERRRAGAPAPLARRQPPAGDGQGQLQTRRVREIDGMGGTPL